MSDGLRPYPRYVLGDDGRGILVEEFEYQTDVLGYSIRTQYILLTRVGYLAISKGYVWDFGSGPAINSPPVVVASLVHDALYDLMAQNLLPRSARSAADREFRKMLRQYGAWWLRSWYMWAAVRVGGIFYGR